MLQRIKNEPDTNNHVVGDYIISYCPEDPDFKFNPVLKVSRTDKKRTTLKMIKKDIPELLPVFNPERSRILFFQKDHEVRGYTLIMVITKKGEQNG